MFAKAGKGGKMLKQLVIISLVIAGSLFSQVPVPKSKEEQEWLERRQREMNEKSERARNEALRLIQMGQEGLAEFKQDKEKYIYTGGTSGYEFISVLGESKEPVAKDMLLEIAIDTTLWDKTRGYAVKMLYKKDLKYNELIQIIEKTNYGNPFMLIRMHLKVVKDRQILNWVFQRFHRLLKERNFNHVENIIGIIGEYPVISQTEKAKIILQIDSLCLAQGWRGLREKYKPGDVEVPYQGKKYVFGDVYMIPLVQYIRELGPDVLPFLRSYKSDDKELIDIIWLARGYIKDETAKDTLIFLFQNSKNKFIRLYAIKGLRMMSDSSLVPVFEKALTDSFREIKFEAFNALRVLGFKGHRIGMDSVYIEKEEKK